MHLCLGAAHDAADGHRTGSVGDHQHVGIQSALGSVERGHPLPGRARRMMMVGRPPAGSLPKQLVVERMQRLADLQHDIVGDVHDVADRAHAGASRRCCIHMGDGAMVRFSIRAAE